MTLRTHRTIVTGLAVALGSVWLTFVVHRSPRFAGSLVGGILGIAAAALMLVPVVYAIVRHLPRLRTWVTRRVSLATLLRVHVASGLLGPILAVVHTGHRFEHPVGIALTAVMLVVAASGFVGYELLRRTEERHAELSALRAALRARLAEHAEAEVAAIAILIAEIELLAEARDRARRWLRHWRSVHLVLTAALLSLLALHVWAALYFGVRW